MIHKYGSASITMKQQYLSYFSSMLHYILVVQRIVVTLLKCSLLSNISCILQRKKKTKLAAELFCEICQRLACAQGIFKMSRKEWTVHVMTQLL